MTPNCFWLSLPWALSHHFSPSLPPIISAHVIDVFGGFCISLLPINIRMLVFSPPSNIQYPISHFQIPHPFQVISIAHFKSFSSHLHRIVWCDRTASFFSSFFPLLVCFVHSLACLNSRNETSTVQFAKSDGHCPANGIYSASEQNFVFFFCLVRNLLLLASIRYNIQYWISKWNRVKTFSTN